MSATAEVRNFDCLHWLHHAVENVSSHYSPTHKQNTFGLIIQALHINFPPAVLQRIIAQILPAFSAPNFNKKQFSSLRDTIETKYIDETNCCT